MSMNRKRSLFVAVVCVCGLVVAAVSLTLVPRLIGYRTFRIPVASMEPTLIAGDHFVADLKCYDSRTPERGDIIVFAYPRDRSISLAKRVVGRAGDTIEVRGKKVILNGKELEEPYAQYLDDRSAVAYGRRFDMKPTKVPQASLFVMGDNRDRTTDSRMWGFVPLADVKGKILFVYWNPDAFSRIGTTF